VKLQAVSEVLSMVSEDKMKMDRELIFGSSSASKSGYLWCLHCERTYRYGEFRLVKVRGFKYHGWGPPDHELQMCPYSDCNGDTVLDGWKWEDVREGHPDYPEVPEHGVVYPLYS